ncbi:MAG: 2,3-bisphosphoglycerate-independent phosphoglycerate mutase [Alphaproteobacteria bacterium]|nr:2,3-bisphosphoglycerate-independent phosphoglycerate mutase [Alphaproteobacteria bacterium]MDP6830990.1 2,3-bisphosphoglycerate-independent phosphoglycerate mutase [Alphaproteobacteria bacterium]
MKNQCRPVVLCILDGWGHREAAADNGISVAKTPNYDRLLAEAPNALLQTSGLAVGLPDGQMGNSEVGHQNIGAGRVVLQNLPRIDAAVADGSMAQNPRLAGFIANLRASGGACHLMGLLSPGGVHSHQDHMLALAGLIADAGITVWLHCFMDGRDTPPTSGAGYMDQVGSAIAEQDKIGIATVCGRYYAMDRDSRWDRVVRAYDLLVDGKGGGAADAVTALRASYAEGINDEFVIPTVIDGYGGMADGDGLLMANFRADRAREILTALTDPDFDGFTRGRLPAFADQLGMVSYSAALDARINALFPVIHLQQTLGEVVARAGLRQLRIAETEKYAHVTFFLNGGDEAVFEGEDRILIPSPKVATYDLAPEMSAGEVTEKLVAAIGAAKYDLIVVNYANPDMVGHTGELDAAVLAVEMIDRCLGRLCTTLQEAGGCMLITADHGNIEMMRDPGNHGAHTAHTTGPVPAILVNAPGVPVQLRDGSLADLAPTLLALMGLAAPEQMTGRSLLITPAQLAPELAVQNA